MANMKVKTKGAPPSGGFKRPENAKQTLGRILGYMAKQKFLLVFVVICIFVSGIAGVIGSFAVKPIINDYILPLVGTDVSSDDLSKLAGVLVGIGAVYLFGAAATYIYQRIMVAVSNRTLNKIREDLFNKMQDLPIKYFDTHTHGELMSRFTNDVDTLREAMSQSFTQLISSAITVTATFVAMLVLSPLLTLCVIAMLVVMIIVVSIFGSRSAKYFKKQQENVGKVNGYVEELVEGLKEVKVFGYEDKAKRNFDEINTALRDSACNANVNASMIMPIMGNLSYLTYAIVAAVGAVMAINGMTDVGTVGSFLLFSKSFSMPLLQMSQLINAILASLAGAERIFGVIDETPELDEGYVGLVNAKMVNGELTETPERTGLWAWKHPHGDGSVTYTQLHGDVEFEDVVFSYDGKKTVLNNVSLFAREGQKIAFVGSTGAGKTTITNLINRFYELQSGKIRYDGINITKIKKADLRRSLAMVLQDTHLFTGTVMENIRYGKLDATDEDVIAAAKLANAHSFIKHLPEGYNTLLTGDGSNLSQEQRQLLPNARAAVENPPVHILDEATSSIDTRTEALIEKGMDKLMDGRTVFVIAHRLSTVRNSDAIMVLENGNIIENGNHDELVARKGRYYSLYTGQFELD